jgi:hypothetical protein
LGNFAQLDVSYGVDHYPFSNNSASLGFHNQVTTPGILGGVEPTTAANPIFYAYSPAGSNLPLTQFSKGPNNTISSPLTRLQSPSAAINLANNATTDVFDFSGMPQCMCTLYYGDDAYNVASLPFQTIRNSMTFFWTGTVFNFLYQGPANILLIQNNLNVLQLKCNVTAGLTRIFWSLEFQRIG